MRSPVVRRQSLKSGVEHVKTLPGISTLRADLQLVRLDPIRRFSGLTPDSVGRPVSKVTRARGTGFEVLRIQSGPEGVLRGSIGFAVPWEPRPCQGYIYGTIAGDYE